MPWPAKPPMTLKEAKRAYKKDGATVRYTASQMARADKIDAQEEKRKKALARDRQRVENKRKREEKAERERRVRQKMLEEGRINIEDTWGKVTASQPRLNKFFGQKGAATSVKSDSRNATSTDKETALPEDLVAADRSPGHRDVVQEAIPTTISKAVLAPSTTKDLTLPSAGKDQHVQAATPSSTHSRSSALRVLSPSQVNARSPVTAKAVNKSHCKPSPKWVEVPRSGLSVSSSSSASPKSTGQSLRAWPRSTGGNADSAGSSEELLPVRVGINAGSKNVNPNGHRLKCSTPEEEGVDKTQTAGACPSQSTVDMDEDEDFTDGIDDETFLLLCATQKPIQIAPSTATSTGTGEALRSPTSTVRAQVCSSRKEAFGADFVTDNSRTVHAMTGPSNELSESFNSVFNEIEDEDLLALAEEVEADLASTNSTPTVAPAAAKIENARSPTLAQQQPLKARETRKPQFVTPSGRSTITRHESPFQERSLAPTRRPPEKNPGEVAKLEAKHDFSREYAMSRNCRGSVSRLSNSRAPESNARVSGTNDRATGTNLRATSKNHRVAVSTPRAGGLNPSSLNTEPPVHNKRLSPPRQQAQRPEPSPAPVLGPKPTKRHRYPWDDNHMDEFPGLGPSTQALSLELLEKVEAQIRDEERRLQAR
ncbi:hypothetical protein PV04_05122 [Phialophora macrospora]|uniref:Uncharacterized protein n=1 Tax=Phialophora macrospora TaxID=1851006 RepID=A0A0D2FM72_9EURO|nr:hypothetical protein PV04_05122 [Phialophora macrospora]